MKMNKKIIVSTLALAMGAALAGSVSGTVAWFQYSTRAQAAFIGESVHCSEMLEVQATAVNGTVNANNWKGELKYSDVATALGQSNANAAKLAPITSGVMGKADALPTETITDDPSTEEVESGTVTRMYANPIYQHFAYNTWEKAVAANYAQFELHFRVKDVDGKETVKLLEKDVYLTNLSIVSLKDKTNGGYEEDTATTSDLYKAIRVHIAAGSGTSAVNALFASNGATAASGVADIETLVGANLDLNNDGEFDTTAAYSDWQTGTVTPYGGATTDKQVAYNVSNKDVFADDTDPTIPAAKKGSIGALGKTGTSDFKVTVTIWIEGWQGLSKQATAAAEQDNANDAQVWDPATYIGKKFGVGLRFAVPAHTAADDQ